MNDAILAAQSLGTEQEKINAAREAAEKNLVEQRKIDNEQILENTKLTNQEEEESYRLKYEKIKGYADVFSSGLTDGFIDIAEGTKSGITVYPQFGSQYNGFVNQNIAFLKNSTIDPNAIRNQDLVGVKATNGNLGAINFTVDTIGEDSAVFNFPAGALKNIAKVGDVVKLVVGSGLQSEMGYFEKELVANDLTAIANEITFDGGFAKYRNAPVFAMWVETADATKSTSSVFKNI